MTGRLVLGQFCVLCPISQLT